MSEPPAPLSPERPARRTATLLTPPVLIAAVAVVLLGWQWLETRARLDQVQEELARRLTDSDAVAKESRALARQSQETVLALQAKAGALEARLAEAQGQQLALEAMYQELSKSRDDRVLAEVEQSVAIAAQQLQLAGNVQAALIAVEGADARLARANQPQFLGLRKMLARDMDRLRAAPAADIPGIALKLDGIVASIDSMPLAFEQRPRAAGAPATRPKTPSASPMEVGYWQALAADIWRETKELVRVERVDRPDPGLLSPSQSFFLRENLKLRLLNARLALLSRDGRVFREDVLQAREWIERYFDMSAKPVQTSLATLKALAAADVVAELPSLNDTLGALHNLRVAKEKK